MPRRKTAITDRKRGPVRVGRSRAYILANTRASLPSQTRAAVWADNNDAPASNDVTTPQHHTAEAALIPSPIQQVLAIPVADPLERYAHDIDDVRRPADNCYDIDLNDNRDGDVLPDNQYGADLDVADSRYRDMADNDDESSGDEENPPFCADDMDLGEDGDAFIRGLERAENNESELSSASVEMGDTTLSHAHDAEFEQALHKATEHLALSKMPFGNKEVARAFYRRVMIKWCQHQPTMAEMEADIKFGLECVRLGVMEEDIVTNPRTYQEALEIVTGVSEVEFCGHSAACRDILQVGEKCKNPNCTKTIARRSRIITLDVIRQIRHGVLRTLIKSGFFRHRARDGGSAAAPIHRLVLDFLYSWDGTSPQIWPLFMAFLILPLWQRRLLCNVALVCVQAEAKAPDGCKTMEILVKIVEDSMREPITLALPGGGHVEVQLKFGFSIADLPGMYKLLNGCHHCCEFPCNQCYVVQVCVSKDNLWVISRHVLIPEKLVIRTLEEWRAHAEQADAKYAHLPHDEKGLKHVMGVKGRCPQMNHTDPTKSRLLEVLHGGALGQAKRLIRHTLKHVVKKEHQRVPAEFLSEMRMPHVYKLRLKNLGEKGAYTAKDWWMLLMVFFIPMFRHCLSDTYISTVMFTYILNKTEFKQLVI